VLLLLLLLGVGVQLTLPGAAVNPPPHGKHAAAPLTAE
jgi:hypothetical protein